LKDKILLCVICIVVGFAFAWWISAEVVSDIEAKTELVHLVSLCYEPNHPEGFRSDWWDIERPPNMDLIDNIQQDFIITLWEHIVVGNKRAIENSKKIKELIHEHSWKRGVSQDKYKVWSGENPAQSPTYFSECRTCGEITTDPDTYYTAQAKDTELVHLVSLCYDPNEPFLTTELVHEQEVEIIEPRHSVDFDGTWANFKCNNKIYLTIAGDGNMSGDCPICGMWVQSSGVDPDRVIKEIEVEIIE